VPLKSGSEDPDGEIVYTQADPQGIFNEVLLRWARRLMSRKRRSFLMVGRVMLSGACAMP